MTIYIKQINEELQNGKGWFVLKKKTNEINEKNLLALMSEFGTPLNIDNLGSKILKVEDQGVSIDQVKSEIVRGTNQKRSFRPYMTNAELEFHTDLCDLLFLMCVNPADEGGLSKVVTSLHVYNYMKQFHRKEFDLLQKTRFRIHHQTPLKPDGNNHIIEIPIFSFKDGYFASHYLKTYITITNEKFNLGLSKEELNALYLIEEVSEKLCTTFKLDKGDVLILNNHTSYHARTEFKDGKIKRSLLRGWVSSNHSQPLNNRYRELFGDKLEAGKVRGGYEIS